MYGSATATEIGGAVSKFIFRNGLIAKKQAAERACGV
jgi:hypothetical protein